MAELITKGNKGDVSKKGKQKKINVRVDFTPMVDMNMLLITFFMLCTSLIKPQTMEISMPSKDKVTEEEQNKVKASKAITVLLGKDNKVYYYFGEPDYENPDFLKETDLSSDGLRQILLNRNEEIVSKINDLKKQKLNLQISDEEFKKQASELKNDKNSPVVIIKPTEFSTYNNMVEALDEMQICNIGRYAIVDIAEGDILLLDNLTHDNYAVNKM
ncbi:MAG: biopolymer transporter ExbD [Bacteroidales bacterium]|nr:biopolymer transporter ExbD [Bacteroidales bacterium]